MPENTVAGFAYAIEQGVDALEMDVAVSRDDVLVLSHDPILPAGALIRELTSMDVRRAGLPTLDEAFQLAGRGAFEYHVEIKSFPEHPEYAPEPEAFARLVLDKIRQFHLEGRAVVLSFDFRTLVAMRTLAPEIRLSALTETDTRAFPAITKEAANAEIISPLVLLVTREKAAEAHEAGIPVVAWTANTPQEWDALIEAQVDAIVTDDPAALIAYLRQRGLR
jgi:glycerophosphoryl diester phosphodiesterase